MRERFAGLTSDMARLLQGLAAAAAVIAQMSATYFLIVSAGFVRSCRSSGIVLQINKLGLTAAI